MVNIAILVGNTNYRNLSKLQCCHDDLLAMKQLIEATQKYDQIKIIEDLAADNLKTEIRTVCEQNIAVNELFFYFSGHGFQHPTDFFYCAVDFEAKSQNSIRS